MPLVKTMEFGELNIHNSVFQTIAGHTATNSYGIVGMVSVDVKSGILDILAKDNYKKGVRASFENEVLNIDMFIVVEYGVKIHEVARNLQKEVEHQINTMTGIDNINVNVFVQGIHVDDDKTDNPNKNKSKKNKLR